MKKCKIDTSESLVETRYRRLCINIMLPMFILVALLASAEYLVLRYHIDQLVLNPALVPKTENLQIGYTQLTSLIVWHLLPYGLILLALWTTLIFSRETLRRKFIIPALQLTDYLQQACQQQKLILPIVPALCQQTLDDITHCFEQHQKTLQKLQVGETFKRAVVDNSMLAVISMDQQGLVTEFNRAAEHVFGFNAEHIIGCDLADMIIPEQSRAAHRAGLERFLLTGQSKAIGAHLELNALHAEGHQFPIELTIFVTPVDQQLAYTAFVADHTQRRQAEEQVAQQREALLQSEKLSAMGALLAGVAHELNNPLAILMGRAALLEDKAKDSDVQADAERIRIAADRCGRIVKTFLSMARQQPVERKWSSLNDVATGAADLLNYSLRSDGIELSLVLDFSLPMIEMDTDKIGQVLVNLIINAQQALSTLSRAKKLQLKTGALAAQQYLQVIDNGGGVPESVKARIFEPFFTTKKEGMGTGIGLSVSRAILREHGGELMLEESNLGASFKIILPAREQQSKIRLDRPTCARPRHEHHEGTVLIVDDEPEVADVLADILRSAGYDVYVANSGNAALHWLDENPCDLLFSDVRMPDMDGITLWRTLRQRHPDLIQHMALITGDTLSISIAPLIAETGLPYLEKPFLP